MANLTDNMKITLLTEAFATMTKEQFQQGNSVAAGKVMEAFDNLPVDSKVRLFDLLSKKY